MSKKNKNFSSKKIERNIRRELRETGELNDIPALKEVQCQKIPTEKFYIPAAIELIEGPDGLLYYNTLKGVELLVSPKYILRCKEEELQNSITKAKELEKSVKEMKPIALGE